MRDGRIDLLIIVFTFPPFPGIGGRRWAKFSKYLLKENVNFKVQSTLQKSKQTSTWMDDVQNVEVEFVDSGYPAYLGVKPTSFFEKVMYRLSLAYSKFKVEGNYYDKSAHWDQSLISYVQAEIDNGVRTIIVSVAPFRTAYTLIKLIAENPSVSWILDVRDPWVDNATSYGYFELSSTRKLFEQEAEKAVVNSFDKVISVSDKMTEYFKKLRPDKPDNFITIPNGFDPDDVNEIQQERGVSEYFTVVFVGALYQNADAAVKALLDFVDRLYQEDKELHSRLRIKFIGTNKVLEGVTDNKVIQYLDRIPMKRVSDELNKANAGMIILTSDINYSFSTKFVEYVAHKLPILVVSERVSPTGLFVKKKGIGATIILNENQSAVDIINELSNVERSSFDEVSNMFNVVGLTKQLQVVIKDLEEFKTP
jgi:glycosyltransferase involved in cell wall biosynthesis